MKKINKWLINNLPWLILVFVGALITVFLLLGNKAEDGTITLDAKPAKISDGTKDFIEEAKEVQIEYAKTAVPALLADGTTVDVPTVEFIDGGKIEEPSKEAGMGAYVYAPTTTFEEFKNYTIGKCWDVDGYYGGQCVDLHNLFQMNYTKDGRWLDLCGTGAARGIWQCKEANAGSEYELIYNASDIKTGDWVITGGGTWGHTCEAAGPYNNGYVACLGENQGGSACPSGGAATNIINLSLSTFLGAFRPKTYIQPEPTPVPVPTPSFDEIYVDKGDTMGGIMLEREGNIEWGSAMNSYADSWCSTLIVPGQSVYYGWTHGTGVGLYAGDILKRCE